MLAYTYFRRDNKATRVLLFKFVIKFIKKTFLVVCLILINIVSPFYYLLLPEFCHKFHNYFFGPTVNILGRADLLSFQIWCLWSHIWHGKQSARLLYTKRLFSLQVKHKFHHISCIHRRFVLWTANEMHSLRTHSLLLECSITIRIIDT